MQKLILIWHLHRLFLNTHIEYLKAVKVEIDICFDLKLTSIDSCFIFHSFVAIGIITQYNMKNIGRNPHAINRDSRWQVTTIFRLSLTRRLILQCLRRDLFCWKLPSNHMEYSLNRLIYTTSSGRKNMQADFRIHHLLIISSRIRKNHDTWEDSCDNM